MLLYYGVLIKISNLHAAVGQSIGKYCTKHAAAELQSKYPARKHTNKIFHQRRHIQQENIVTTLLTVSRGNAKIEQELILQHHTIKSMQY